MCAAGGSRTYKPLQGLTRWWRETGVGLDNVVQPHARTTDGET